MNTGHMATLTLSQTTGRMKKQLIQIKWILLSPYCKCSANDTNLSCALISSIRSNKGASEEDAKNLDEIKGKIETRPNAFFEMESFLPKKNG